MAIPNGLPRNFRCRVINNQSGTLTFNPSGPTTINGSGTSRTIATPSSPNHTWVDIMHVLGGDDYTLVGSALT